MSDSDSFRSTIFIAILMVMILSGVVFVRWAFLKNDTAATYTVQLLSIDSKDEDDCDFTLGIVSQGVKYEERRYYVANEICEDGSIELFTMLSDVTIINAILGKGAQAYAEVIENHFGEIMTVQLYVPKNYKRKVF